MGQIPRANEPNRGAAVRSRSQGWMGRARWREDAGAAVSMTALPVRLVKPSSVLPAWGRRRFVLTARERSQWISLFKTFWLKR